MRMAAANPASRLLSGGAALLATSVLADSAMEHYRGSFHNPAMVAPIGMSLLAIGNNGAQAVGAPGVMPVHVLSVAIGAAGLGFHAYDILVRPGGLRLLNLFYAAPIGAPAALTLAGLLGGAARTAPNGRLVGTIVAGGLIGTVCEAGLLHFRGAYHNPAMWLPVALPPLAAVSLALDVMAGSASRRSCVLLVATALLGIVGAAFHVYGVSRNMGGWRNWRQNLLAGPPIPAPPAFTGLAIAGWGALRMLPRHG